MTFSSIFSILSHSPDQFFQLVNESLLDLNGNIWKKKGFILLSWWMKPCFGICGANIYRWWNGCSLWEAIFFLTSVFEMWIINCLLGSFRGWRKKWQKLSRTASDVITIVYKGLKAAQSIMVQPGSRSKPYSKFNQSYFPKGMFGQRV